MTQSADTVAAPGAPATGMDSAASRSPLRWLRTFLQNQDSAWFAPADARALAICRVILFWNVWPGFRVVDYAFYADFRSSAWYPVSFFRAWSVPLLEAPGLHAVSLVASVASLCALLGLLYPLSAWMTFLATLYLHGVPQNFGKVNHSDNLLILALCVFACARAADAWSLDALIRPHIPRWRQPSSPSGHYRWPVRFIALLVVVMYASAGCSKLIHSGWDWALSESFQRLLLRHHFTHKPPTQLGVWIASMPALCKALALGALLTELSAPLALLGRWPFRVILPALFLLQVSIWCVLGVKFTPMLPLFECLLPWNAFVMLLDRGVAFARTRRLDAAAHRKLV
jgi:hypothetical protein